MGVKAIMVVSGFGHDRLDDLRNAGVIPANMTAEEFLKDDKGASGCRAVAPR